VIPRFRHNHDTLDLCLDDRTTWISHITQDTYPTDERLL
jgi:hypothetical protein